MLRFKWMPKRPRLDHAVWSLTFLDRCVGTQTGDNYRNAIHFNSFFCIAGGASLHMDVSKDFEGSSHISIGVQIILQAMYLTCLCKHVQSMDYHQECGVIMEEKTFVLVYLWNLVLGLDRGSVLTWSFWADCARRQIPTKSCRHPWLDRLWRCFYRLDDIVPYLLFLQVVVR